MDSSTPDQTKRVEAVTGPQNSPLIALIIRIVRFAYSAAFPAFSVCASRLRAGGQRWEGAWRRPMPEPFRCARERVFQFDASSEETLHTGPFGDLTILIVSHDPAAGIVQ